MENTHLTDQELWECIREDDRDAFSILFERYWKKLFTTACYHLNDREVCTEVVHDIFLNIWNGRRELQINSFPGYLSTAVRYHVLHYRKALRMSPLLYKDNWENEIEANSTNRGDEKLIYNELQSEVTKSMEKLPKRCQEIFILSRWENLSNDQIAEQLGISKRTVENQLTFALKFLRVSIKKLLVLFCVVGHFWF